MREAEKGSRLRVLEVAAARAARYFGTLNKRSVVPDAAAIAALGLLGGALPEDPLDAVAVVRLLDESASPAIVASAGPRYFGFVTGGTLPAALGAAALAPRGTRTRRSK